MEQTKDANSEVAAGGSEQTSLSLARPSGHMTPQQLFDSIQLCISDLPIRHLCQRFKRTGVRILHEPHLRLLTVWHGN